MAQRVLIIDDHALFAHGLALIVQQGLGLTAEVAGSVEAALLKLQGGTPFALALLDLELPGTSGIEGMHRLLAADAALPVVGCRSHGSELARQATLARGARAFVGKGEAPEQLLAVMRRVLRDSLSAHLPALRAFLWPNVLAVAGLCLWQGGTLHAVIALAALVYGVTGARFARAMHEVQRRSLLQREELAEVAADLAVQKERAQMASGAKSHFLAAASHDIRQPVHALNLFLGAFDERALQGRNAALIGPLRESARGLREMLDGVLDLSRAESGAVALHTGAVPVQALLDMAEREFAPLAEAKGLVLRTVPSTRILQADAMLTERVLRNLVSNAVRYTGRGGVLIAARQRGEQVVLEVWDTGVGIAENERAAVFEEFRRGAQAPSNERAGLGLALAIARRFAQVQGGVRSLASRPGRGSVFRLALPGLDAATAATLPAPAPPQGDEAQRLRGLRVLVVDDDAAVRQATALLLQDWGCWPQLLASPDEWDAACTADVTLCDNQFNGQARAHEVAARLAVAPGARLPLVVATGDIAAPNLRLLQDRGALVLAKPLDPLQLRQALLSRCAAGAAAGAAT